MTVIFTALALILSLITLWFSHLKGPDIELGNILEAELEDWSKDLMNNHVVQNYVPDHLRIKPIQIVFVNNGSRAGAITRIEAEFEPNEKFKPLYRDKYVRVETEERELPVSIEAGDTRIIKLSSDIKVIDWKQNFRYEEIKDTSNLKEAFTKSIELDRTRFGEFVSFLRSRETLGRLEIEMTYLGRRWLKSRTKTRKIANIQVKNNCEIAVEGFEKLLEDWDTSSAVNKLLQRIPDILDMLTQKLMANSEKIQKEVKAGSFQGLDDLSDYWRRLYEQRNIIWRIIFEREKDLKTRLDEPSRQITRYNARGSFISMAREDVEAEQIDALNQERRRIQSLNEEMLSKLRRLRAELVGEIQ